MKTNFLKTSLFAFTFALAIVASFAFSPALNDAEDEVNGYIQTFDPEACTLHTATTCNQTGITNCTVSHAGSVTLYKDQNDTVCSNPLKDNRE